MATLSQWPIEASFVEKPPVDAVLKAWATASNGPMPASSRLAATTIVNPRYSDQNLAAVALIRGAKRSTPIPGASASIRPKPLELSAGSTMTTRTTMPIPPAHWVSWR